jgi:hypothetical protein
MSTLIENLALKKDWPELSPAEQAAVLAEMDTAEYQQLHATLVALRQLDAEVTPPARLRKVLLEQAAQARFRRQRWHQQPIPLWQAAAAVLIGIATTIGFIPVKQPSPSSPTLVQVRDTLIQEKILWKERVITRPVLVSVQQDTAVEPKGVSLEDAPELLQLFTAAEGER